MSPRRNTPVQNRRQSTPCTPRCASAHSRGAPAHAQLALVEPRGRHGAARASAYDAAGNLKVAARKACTSAVSRTCPSSPRGNSLLIHFAVHMSPRPSASPSLPSHLPSYLPPALFPAHDVIITDNPTPSPTPRSAAAAPTDTLRPPPMILCSDAHLKSFAFVNPPHAMSAVARRHTARPTTLEAEAMTVASPDLAPFVMVLQHSSVIRASCPSRRRIADDHSQRPAPGAPPAPLPTQCVRSTALTPPIRTPLMPPHHAAIAPLLPSRFARLARPPVRQAPHHAKAMAFLSKFNLFFGLTTLLCSIVSRLHAPPPCARARLNGDYPPQNLHAFTRVLSSNSRCPGPATGDSAFTRAPLAQYPKSAAAVQSMRLVDAGGPLSVRDCGEGHVDTRGAADVRRHCEASRARGGSRGTGTERRTRCLAREQRLTGNPKSPEVMPRSVRVLGRVEHGGDSAWNIWLRAIRRARPAGQVAGRVRRGGGCAASRAREMRAGT
ncbi:hypothetical protein FB451DRAFT_1452398 [Mycena latifolia]|nr:hypothetical protein FB451DRAFT_1452398 [Mycena latifolia]